MRVLLISPNQTSFPYRVTPLGLLVLAAVLEQEGHEVHLVDLMFSKHPEQDIASGIAAFQPHVVGISLRNVDSVASKHQSHLSFYAKCVAQVRKWTEVPLILGGPALTAYVETFVEQLQPDWAIAGDATRSLPLLLRRLERHEEPFDVPGLAWMQDGTLHCNAPDYLVNLDELPHQAIERIDFRRYARHGSMFGVVTQRGCPHHCVFCDDRQICGPTLRFRSPGRVVDEIEFIRQRTGMKYYAFADPAFNCNRKHMVGVLREIIARGLDIRFQVELNPLNQDEETVGLLKQAGCIGVDYTCDTGSMQMCRALKKSFSPASILRVARLYAAFRIPYTAGFLLGGPGENRQTVSETLLLAQQLSNPSVVYFSVGLTLLPFSELARTVAKQAVVKSDNDPMQVAYYLDERFDAGCARLVQDACERNPNFFIAESFYERSVQTGWRLLDWANVRPSYRFRRFNQCVASILPSRLRSLAWNDQQRRFVGA